MGMLAAMGWLWRYYLSDCEYGTGHMQDSEKAQQPRFQYYVLWDDNERLPAVFGEHVRRAGIHSICGQPCECLRDDGGDIILSGR